MLKTIASTYDFFDQTLQLQLTTALALKKVWLVTRDSDQDWEVPFTYQPETGRLALDCDPLILAIPQHYQRYYFVLETVAGERSSISLQNYKKIPLPLRYFARVRLQESLPLSADFYLSLGGEFSLVVRNPAYTDQTERHLLYQHEILALKMNQQGLTVSCALETQFLETILTDYTGAVLRLNSNLIEAEIQGKITTRRLGKQLQLTLVFPQAQFTQFEQGTYGLYLTARDRHGVTTYLPLKLPSHELYQRLLTSHLKTSLLVKSLQQIFELGVGQDGLLRWYFRAPQALDHPANGWKLKLAELARKILPDQKQPCLLLYEKECETAQDNAFAFFKFLMQASHPYNFYYVIAKDSPQKDKLRAFQKHVVQQYSWKYFWLICSNSVLVSSESRIHLGGFWSYSGRLFFQLQAKKHIFLQHGVTAAKKVTVFKKGASAQTDYFCVSSQGEQEIIVRELGYQAEQVWLTGFPRWDQEKPRPKKQILLMPTWRPWLENLDEQRFRASSYYQRLTSLLGNPELLRTLKEHDTQLVFCPHPKFTEWSRTFTTESEQIVITNQNEADIPQLIATSQLLISDYSSVLWDFLYDEKPVLLYQFDLAEYLASAGSFIDHETVFHTVRAETEADLVTKLTQSMAANYPIDLHEFATWFAHHDHRNSQRVLTQINAHWPELQKANVPLAYDAILATAKLRLATQKDYIKKNVTPA